MSKQKKHPNNFLYTTPPFGGVVYIQQATSYTICKLCVVDHIEHSLLHWRNHSFTFPRMTIQEQLRQLQKEADQAIASARTLDDLDAIDQNFFGRKNGKLTLFIQGVSALPKDERPAAGKEANAIKRHIAAVFADKRSALEAAAIEGSLQKERIEVTQPILERLLMEEGHLHPITRVREELEDIFVAMGFDVWEGPEVESEYYNFEALNIPADHPARDTQDTFWLHETAGSERLLLRTHTSPMQIRAMRAIGAPLKIIVPGRVYRYEATDASHETTFDQVEGLLIDEHISMSDLIGVFRTFLRELFQKDVDVRLRPGYFPFVEPGVELDLSCVLCEGKGCSVCKKTGWVEFMGAGLVHPHVLKAGNIDAKKYQGFAFGFGLTRLVMMKYRITDIRLLLSGDLRLLQQF